MTCVGLYSVYKKPVLLIAQTFVITTVVVSSSLDRKEMETDTDTAVNAGGFRICGWILTALSWLLVIFTFPLSLLFCLKVVQEYERVVIFRLGRLVSGSGGKGPGLYFNLPCISEVVKVDLRTAVFDVPPQEILTKDSVSASVDAVVYFRISDPTSSVTKVENANVATKLLAQTTLRNILGMKALHEILSERESISASMQTILDEATSSWGIKVERVEIQEVRLSQDLQRSMAAEAEATREAKAKVMYTYITINI